MRALSMLSLKDNKLASKEGGRLWPKPWPTVLAALKELGVSSNQQ
jgi:hypothetical protein